MINFIVWLIAGACLGWLAGQWLGQPEGRLLNVCAGSAGALVAGFGLAPLLHLGSLNPNHLNLPALLVALLGAVILLVAVSILRGPRLRLH
jgi:uncharacterized membrane protein YeaQ/YmgE (transglycosylase-associated protein family)